MVEVRRRLIEGSRVVCWSWNRGIGFFDCEDRLCEFWFEKYHFDAKIKETKVETGIRQTSESG